MLRGRREREARGRERQEGERRERQEGERGKREREAGGREEISQKTQQVGVWVSPLPALAMKYGGSSPMAVPAPCERRGEGMIEGKKEETRVGRRG